MKQNKINILGINISKFRKTEVLQTIEKYLNDKNQHYIATVNPEFILAARKDEEFFYILNKADLAVPDGFGLKCAAWAMGQNLYRYPGADMIKDILLIAQKDNIKISILNWRDGLSGASDIERALISNFPNLTCSVNDIDRQGLTVNFKSIVEFEPKILLVSLGAPYQEKFIFHNLKNIPSVRLAIGIGGALDFLTGRIKRAPKIFRILGIEWLWRLICQPWRWRRIINAAIIFPWEFFKWRFVKPFLYRPSVVCLLYKRAGDKYKMLLVKRAYQKEHWQLPQGGTDGESLKTAGIRELSEEINCEKFKPIAIFKKLHKYLFKETLSKFGPLAKLVWGYKGQKQGLFIAKFFGQGKDIRINFWEHSEWKWVDSEDLINEVHLIRREATKIFLEKFNQVIKKYGEKD